MKTKLIISFAIFVGLSILSFKICTSHKEIANKNVSFENHIKNKVIVTATPKMSYNYDYMKNGVLQHIDRDYSYYYIPTEMVNGILYQGIHRPVKGTSIKLNY